MYRSWVNRVWLEAAPTPVDRLFGETDDGADQAMRQPEDPISLAGDSQPSSSREMTTPAPPAPPSGAMPERNAVNMTSPLASCMTLAGILRITLTLRSFFFDFSPTAGSVSASALAAGASAMTPVSAHQYTCVTDIILADVLLAGASTAHRCHGSPVKDLRIRAHFSISFAKSPVTGQNASVPNLSAAIVFTLPPMLSDRATPLSMATLPQAAPRALSLDFHPPAAGSSGGGVGAEGVERRGGGG